MPFLTETRWGPFDAFLRSLLLGKQDMAYLGILSQMSGKHLSWVFKSTLSPELSRNSPPIKEGVWTR